MIRKTGNIVSKVRDRRARRALSRARTRIKTMPGPTPNSATNLMIADVLLRGASMVIRRGMERGLLGARYDRQKARDIVAGRSMGQTVLSGAAAYVATRSLPGLLLVGGGLLAKVAFERGRDRRARHKGERQIAEMAHEGRDADPLT